MIKNKTELTTNLIINNPSANVSYLLMATYISGKKLIK